MPTVPAHLFLHSRDFRARYLDLGLTDLRRRAEEALNLLRACVACPRDCGINRLENRYAVCKTGRYARVSSFFPHLGEEDCLRGWRGSGTIFFAWCNLRCVFCVRPDTVILTNLGARRIADIYSNGTDEVSLNGGTARSVHGLLTYTHHGKPAPIVRIYRHHYRGELVVLKPHGLPALNLTPNHSVFVVDRLGGRIEELRADQLNTSHCLVVPKLRRPASSNSLKAFWVPIRAIARESYDGPVYNLEVGDDDHSYTAHGVAVANCQNFDISQEGHGREVGPLDLARMMLFLQDAGCHNINFVTPEHVVPQILEALPAAVEMGLHLPIVYNTSAYDSPHSLRLLDGIVDIYMPDFKFWDREMSRLYLKAPDYPEVARAVIREMHRQVGPLKLDEHGLAKRGVLIRHLVMPGGIAGTLEILRWIATELGSDAYVNVMDQYRPAGRVGTDARYDSINRRVFPEEFEAAVIAAQEVGLSRLDVRSPRGPRLPWVPA